MDLKEVYQTSSLTIPEPEVEEFVWNFKVPPRSKMQKNIESVKFGGFIFPELRFKTGFMSGIDHQWGITFYSNQINIRMILPPRDLKHRYALEPSSLQLISLKQVKATHSLTFQQDDIPIGPKILWTTFWIHKDDSWDDSVDMVRVVFRVSREIAGTCGEFMVSQECAIRNKAVLASSNVLNSNEFFMNPHLSDVTLQCKGESFPGHRFLLSCRSPVFAQMFKTDMREKTEGLVVIDDMEPEVLKLLLKYMYSGQLEDLALMDDMLVMELFQAADKYNLEGLKVLCEPEIVKKIKRENCLEMYAMADMFDARLLKEQACDMIKLNKKEIFVDLQIFKEFSAKFPDVVYELFSSLS